MIRQVVPVGRRSLNPFTLRVPLENSVCYSHTFENNFGIKQKSELYLKRVVVWLLINIFGSNVFQKILLYVKHFENCQACSGWSECKWLKFKRVFEA